MKPEAQAFQETLGIAFNCPIPTSPLRPPPRPLAGGSPLLLSERDRHDQATPSNGPTLFPEEVASAETPSAGVTSSGDTILGEQIGGRPEGCRRRFKGDHPACEVSATPHQARGAIRQNGPNT